MPSRTLSAANRVVVPCPDIIVGHCSGSALLHRQAWLGAVERLNLRFLIDRQHEAVGRRVEIEPHHVAQLGGKGRILGQFEAPHAMRLQAVRRPDPLHRAQRHADGCGHRPAGPMRRLAGRRSERQRHHALDQRRWQRRQARLSGLLAQQASHALAHEPLLPAPYTGLRDPGAAHNFRRAAALGGRQNDPRPPDMFLRAVAIRDNRGQSLAVRGTHLNADPLAHDALSHIQR